MASRHRLAHTAIQTYRYFYSYNQIFFKASSAHLRELLVLLLVEDVRAALGDALLGPVDVVVVAGVGHVRALVRETLGGLDVVVVLVYDSDNGVVHSDLGILFGEVLEKI